MKDAYTDALAKIFNDDSAAKPTDKSRAEIEDAIADISERLKGPLNNVERIWLVEDRKELRKQLSALSAD